MVLKYKISYLVFRYKNYKNIFKKLFVKRMFLNPNLWPSCVSHCSGVRRWGVLEVDVLAAEILRAEFARRAVVNVIKRFTIVENDTSPVILTCMTSKECKNTAKIVVKQFDVFYYIDTRDQCYKTEQDRNEWSYDC